MSTLDNKMILAKNLKYYMEEEKVSAKNLSQALEVPYTTVLSWLKADNYPRIDKIELMAEYFEISKSDLIEEKEKNIPAAQSKDHRDLINFVNDLSEDEASQVLQMVKLLVQGLRK